MKPNLKDIQKQLSEVPSTRLPLNRASWLQEWNDVRELVDGFEKQLQEKLMELEKRQELCDAEVYEFINEILGEGEAVA